MKTFRELIAWELEQDRRRKRPVPAEQNGSRLTDFMLRKLKYLNANPSEEKALPHRLEIA